LTAATALLLAWKRLWRGLVTLGLAVPGGMLVNEVMKLSIQRHRPFASSPYIDVSGYSFPSGHTMAAALLYGMLAVFAVSVIKSRRWQLGVATAAFSLVLVVAFSRVALGAHYVTDVTGAILVSSVWLYFCFNAVRKLPPPRVPVRIEAGD
jgi:undecaprenyl-diphosphatase